MRNQKILFKNPNRPANILIGQKQPKKPLANMHFHSELEFIYVDSGALRCGIESNSPLIANKGEIIFINSNTPHSSESLEDGSSHTVIQLRNPSILKNALKYLSILFRHSPTSAYVFKKDDPDYEEFLGCLTSMIKESQNKEIAYDYYITANIYMIIAILHRKNFLSVEENLVDFQIIERIIPTLEYIDERYNEKLTLASLANQLHMNKDYFCRLFKKATGTTVTDYINFVRVCKAEELLQTDLNVSDVCYTVGFSSLSYFNRIFKKYKLCSPSVYKRIYKRPDKLISK